MIQIWIKHLWNTLILYIQLYIVKINDYQGNPTDISGKIWSLGQDDPGLVLQVETLSDMLRKELRQRRRTEAHLQSPELRSSSSSNAFATATSTAKAGGLTVGKDALNSKQHGALPAADTLCEAGRKRRLHNTRVSFTSPLTLDRPSTCFELCTTT